MPLPGHFADFRELFEYIASIRPVRALTEYFKVLDLLVALKQRSFSLPTGALLDVRQQRVRVGGDVGA